MKYVVAFLFLFGLQKKSTAQELNVSNIRVSQEGNRIIINYDLKITAFISLIVLEDGKEKIGFKVNGDLGYNPPGDSKKIVLTDDTETIICQGCIFRVISSNVEFGTVLIGEQTWQIKNLNISKFRNGDNIPEAKTFKEWLQADYEKRPAWCYYNNDTVNGEVYGRLYNWYAVNDPRGLAPQGWHIPSDNEWNILIRYLGGKKEAGVSMKSKTGWLLNGNGTNASNFSGLPGGMRDYNAKFKEIGQSAYWWSSSSQNRLFAWHRVIYSWGVERFALGKGDGYSVRCLKD